MKIHQLKKGLFIPFFLLFLGGACEKDENEYEEIALEYIKCPCDHETNFIKEISQENVLLFDAAKTPFPEMKELTSNGERSEFISYSPESDSTVFYSFVYVDNNNIPINVHTGYICNFPALAKEWEIPSNGIYISFSADVFDACNGKPSAGFTHTYSDNILTSFKKKKK